MYIYVYVYIFIYTHMYIYVYTYIYTCTYISKNAPLTLEITSTFILSFENSASPGVLQMTVNINLCSQNFRRAVT
jgi:hypothetical protein